MPIANTARHYGTISKILHWSTALLIAALIPLGILAHDAPLTTDAELARKALLFSWHKTLGVVLFGVALLRILWAISQSKPAPLHPDARFETWLAEVVHWLLYGSLVLVPLSGWLHHSAATVGAPIWGPLERLPFVPRDPALSHLFAVLHVVFERVLVLSILLHIAGALKHVLIDRDGTLARMWFGQGHAEPSLTRTAKPPVPPVLAAFGAWAAALGVAAGLGLFSMPDAAPATTQATLAVPESEWQVKSGQIGFTVTQFGAEVAGGFPQWRAAIDYDPDTGAGQVETEIAITSLSLGSVTEQALAPAYFDAATHPTATYRGTLSREDGQGWARGTLTLRGVAQQVDFPFTLNLTGAQAQMTGTLELDRHSFSIGPESEDTVGPKVSVGLAVTATRAE